MIARNGPCPCGSGRKHKLCCGTTRTQEWEHARKAAVVAELMELPLHFPRLRPGGEAFSAWADEVAPGELGDARVNDGIAVLEARERARIVRAHAKEFPDVWRGFCADLAGDEELAGQALVAGAVVAAIGERQPPDASVLELLEDTDDLRRDPCEALAIALEAGDLWSIHESVQVDEALAALPEELDDDAYEAAWNEVVEREAMRLWTRWHERRLALLVRRLRAQLPLAGFPATSAALETASAACERDAALRRRLAKLLLSASLIRMPGGLPLAV